MNEELLKIFDDETLAMHARCEEQSPNFGVTVERFRASLRKTVEKALFSEPSSDVTGNELKDFLAQIQADDLFLAVACSDGNERGWWEFDQSHRAYMGRVARHLAKTEIDADEVVDWVYGELFGTRVVDGERVSKFSAYGGRGSLRGWLRTVIWHSIVDLHRASHDEISLDEMTENVGEGSAQALFAVTGPPAEEAMVDRITRERYGAVTVSAITAAFAVLDDHEKLLLSYYHIDRLKLREIARLAENGDSPLRGWFQRRSASRDINPGARVHESTVMRWLEKCYARVLARFNEELSDVHGLRSKEIELCIGLATQDLMGGRLFRDIAAG